MLKHKFTYGFPTLSDVSPEQIKAQIITEIERVVKKKNRGKSY